MPRLMLISDTHEDLATMREVLDYLNDAKVDIVIHLGDYYNDADILEDAGHNLIRVPGTWDSHYYDPDVQNRLFIDVEGWRIFLTHTPESHYNDLSDDIKPEDVIHNRNADIFLCGHTHLASIRRVDGMIFINPGHMSCHENRGCPLTYVILDIEGDTMIASIWQLFKDEPYIQKRYEKSSLKRG